MYSASSFGDLTAPLPDSFLNQIAPGAENGFFGLQSNDVALLSNGGPMYQPFTNQPGTDDSLGPASFDTIEDVNLGALHLDPDPPAFRDDYPLGDSILGANQDENEQPVSSSPDVSLFSSFDG